MVAGLTLVEIYIRRKHISPFEWYDKPASGHSLYDYYRAAHPTGGGVPLDRRPWHVSAGTAAAAGWTSPSLPLQGLVLGTRSKARKGERDTHPKDVPAFVVTGPPPSPDRVLFAGVHIREAGKKRHPRATCGKARHYNILNEQIFIQKFGNRKKISLNEPPSIRRPSRNIIIIRSPLEKHSHGQGRRMSCHQIYFIRRLGKNSSTGAT